MVVAFIPEGLLPTVICTDKTGTLTQNEMTVIHLWLAGKEYEVTGVGYGPEGNIVYDDKKVAADDDVDLNLLLTGAALCSNARLLPLNEESARYTVLGDPTEACLGVVAQKAGIDVHRQMEETPRIRELPFESRRLLYMFYYNLSSLPFADL